MTYEEAIIKLLPITDNMAYTDVFQDACKVAIEALEKQIPMKPNHGMAQRNRWRSCHACCARVINTYKFCDQCGQKLDWE